MRRGTRSKPWSVTVAAVIAPGPVAADNRRMTSYPSINYLCTIPHAYGAEAVLDGGASHARYAPNLKRMYQEERPLVGNQGRNRRQGYLCCEVRKYLQMWSLHLHDKAASRTNAPKTCC
jgi:hypothetical protein